jgi:pimeloyl-ACP methyl ester carboxylesterase
MWKPFAVALSRQFHVYLLDRPGFGESPQEQPLQSDWKPDSTVSKYDSDLARQSEAFAALFKTWQSDWKGQRPHVIAHDNAGLLSLRAHLLHDCQYASLCLINVVAIGPFGQSLFSAVAEDPARFERLPNMAFRGILEGYIRNAAYHELPKETMEMLKAPWLRPGGKAGFLRELCQANARSTDAVEGRYGGVGKAMPVKVIWGANDEWIPVKDAHRLGDALNAREVVTIEEAGHLSMIDQPGQVGVEFGRWLSSL